MPTIHHPDLGVERDVDDVQAEILTTNPRVPWRYGPLPKPTAKKKNQPSPEGDTTPSTEED